MPDSAPVPPAAPSTQEQMFAFQHELLTKEIDYIHSQISHFDTLSFQIKGWAITVWAAIIAFGSSQATALVVLASIPAMITFWVLDAFFKRYQRRFFVRMAVIEQFLDSSGVFEDNGLQAAFAHKDFGRFPIHDPIAARTRRLNPEFTAWYRESTSYWKAFLVANVAYFYLFLIVSSVTIALILG